MICQYQNESLEITIDDAQNEYLNRNLSRFVKQRVIWPSFLWYCEDERLSQRTATISWRCLDSQCCCPHEPTWFTDDWFTRFWTMDRTLAKTQSIYITYGNGGSVICLSTLYSVTPWSQRFRRQQRYIFSTHHHAPFALHAGACCARRSKDRTWNNIPGMVWERSQMLKQSMLLTAGHQPKEAGRAPVQARP